MRVVPNARQIKDFLTSTRRFEEEVLPRKLVNYEGSLHAVKLAYARAEAFDPGNAALIEKLFRGRAPAHCTNCGDIRLGDFNWRASTNLRVLVTGILHLLKSVQGSPSMRRKPDECVIFPSQLSMPVPGWATFKGIVERNLGLPEHHRNRVRAATSGPDKAKADQTFLYADDFSPPLIDAEISGMHFDPAVARSDPTFNYAKPPEKTPSDPGMIIAENNFVVLTSTRPGPRGDEQRPGFWRQAKRLSKLVFTGPSGTSQMLMDYVRHMGLLPEELLLFRLALMGWQMAVRDHSFHEVMSGLDGFHPLLEYPLDGVPWAEAYNHLLPASLTVRSLQEASESRDVGSVRTYNIGHLETHLFGEQPARIW